MRLTKYQIETIKKYTLEVFNTKRVYLFGSRVDDTKRGGDIDLYIELDDKSELFKKRIKILAKLKRYLGEQKIDVIFNEDSNRLIEKEAKKWGIAL